MSEELVVQDPMSEAELALINANAEDADDGDIRVPILKVAQALTKEVQDGDAQAGDFVLGLTGESFGNTIEFVVAAKGPGRIKLGRNGERTMVADTPTVPWTDDQFYGKPFTEHPDAEEQYSKRVNESGGKIPWGKGPQIQTLYNLTGFIVNNDDPEETFPVRLSLRLTNKPVKDFKKSLDTFLNVFLRHQYHAQTVILKTEQKTNANGDRYFVPTFKKGRKTTKEERALAVQLGVAVKQQSVTAVGEEGVRDPEAPAPTAVGDIDV